MLIFQGLIIFCLHECLSVHLFWAYLWSHQGHIIGYHAADMAKYSCWRAHYDDVVQLLPNEKGLVSISTDNIRYYSREGKLQLSFSKEQLTDLSCCVWSNANRSAFAVGSHQHAILSIFDLRRGRIMKEVPLDSTASCMSRSSRQFCIGDIMER